MKKTVLKALAVVSCSIITSLPLTAKAVDDVFQDSGSWLQLMAEGSLKAISPDLANARIWLEGQSRYDRDFSHWYQGMARVAVGYSLSDRATVWAGYTWLPTENLGKPYLSQQDIWPGFRYVLPTSWGTLMFRTLVEVNFLEGDDERYRPRQMLRFMHPLAIEPRLSLIAWDEFFIRLNTTKYGGDSGFDQNRAFAGLGWTF
ncbi:DUF2490 domain-containing protein [Methylocucumis oryzae]|uniref:DUF2490 domain-containing protein n=1 Tax=Methylocucumis oryzae TaxID=1632867 RepID=UPI000AF5F993|nr:DUF2490 domain-containing protein [Methylocucumis oryzae]